MGDDDGRCDRAGTDQAEAVTSALLTASRLLVGLSLRSLAAVDPPLTLPQFRALVVLAERGPMKLASLADLLGVNASTALRMVERLRAADVVSRRTNPEVRREVILELTANGRRVVGEGLAARRGEIAAIVARMPARDRSGLVAGLRAFGEAGGERPFDPGDGIAETP